MVSPYVMQSGEIASAILLRKGQKLHYHFFAKCIFLSMYAESVKKNVLVLVFSFNTAVFLAGVLKIAQIDKSAD